MRKLKESAINHESYLSLLASKHLKGKGASQTGAKRGLTQVDTQREWIKLSRLLRLSTSDVHITGDHMSGIIRREQRQYNTYAFNSTLHI